eukprot:6293705-Amphidinium_carterae.1
MKCEYLSTLKRCVEQGLEFSRSFSPTVRQFIDYIARSGPEAATNSLHTPTFALHLSQRLSISLQRDAARAVHPRLLNSQVASASEA